MAKEIQDIDLKQLIEDETGQRFNKENKIRSPFNPMDKHPSFGIWFNSNRDKWMWKDFSEGSKVGDAIDFLREYKGLDFKAARKYLGMEVELTAREKYMEKIKEYIKWQQTTFLKDHELLGLFVFVDENNTPVYCKAKFQKPDGSKMTPYYSIVDDKVQYKRNHDELPYNYYNLIQGFKEGKVIIPVEGEKDVHTVSSMLNKSKYVATSFKGIKDFTFIINLIKKYYNNDDQEFKILDKKLKMYAIGDTENEKQDGSATRYVDKIKKIFFDYCDSFKIINLPEIKKLGYNKDVTDWVENGHTKDELYTAFKRSLDLKDTSVLQQNDIGVYRTWFEKAKEGEPAIEHKKYLTDFNVVEASKIKKVDAEVDGIKLKLKSCIDGKTVEKIANSKVLDDLKSFRNFLGIDFNFLGDKASDLIAFRSWVIKYFAIDFEEIYEGAQFYIDSDKINFIGSEGCLCNGRINYTKKAESTNIDLLQVEKIDKKELEQLIKYLFSFLSKDKSYCIIGSVINDLAIVQAEQIGVKFHHMMIVGESESGKSTILEQILMPLLNMPLQDKQSIATSPFAIIKVLSSGNYPVVFDEFKPSMMNNNKQQRISDILRNSYDRTKINRGDKSFKVKEFKLTRPLIMAGEESYPNSEKALTTRSCIVYISKNERTQESHDATFWLIDHKNLLNKLGKSLVMEVINMPVEEYQSIRESIRPKFGNQLHDRPLTTAINVACGLEIFNNVLERNGLDNLKIKDYIAYITANIKEEVLDGGDEAHSLVEQMLILYEDMISKNLYKPPIHSEYDQYEDTPLMDCIKVTDDGKLYIKTSQMIDYIFKYCRDFDSADIKPLKYNDFRKQALKSGYIIEKNSKTFRVNVNRPTWFDRYDTAKILYLGCKNIANEEKIQKIFAARERGFKVLGNE